MEDSSMVEDQSEKISPTVAFKGTSLNYKVIVVSQIFGNPILSKD
jgi:hypothetical protein